MDEIPVEYKPDWGYLSSGQIAQKTSQLTFGDSDSYELGELHLACLCGSVERAVQAVRYGANVEATTGSGESPLHIACRQGHLDVVQFLLKIGSNSNAVDCCLQTPIFKVSCERNLEIISDLLKHGAVLNTFDLWNNSLLDWACIQHDAVKVRELLKNGMNPDSHGRNASPLHLACAFGDVDVVSCLLEYRAQVNCFNERWLSPLHVAAYNDHVKIAQVLLKYGAKIHYEGVVSPLHLAASKGHVLMVEFLLKSGLEPNVVDERGATALHYASSFLQPNVAVVLLQSGADPNAKDNDKFTPLIYLLRHECQSNDADTTFYWHDMCDIKLIQFLNILLENGLILGPDVYTYTTEFLHSETSSGYSRSLLQYEFDSESDSDYDAWNYDLYVATDNGHLGAVQLLLKAGMQFEQNEWFMDDEWLTDDIEYGLDSIHVVTAWCKWRFLAGIGPPVTGILTKILQGCKDILSEDSNPEAEDPSVVENARTAIPEVKADVEWILQSLNSPRSLLFLCCASIRKCLLSSVKSCNILPCVNQLPVPQKIKDALKLSHLPPKPDHLQV